MKEPTTTYHVVRGIFIIVFFLGFTIWASVRALKRSEDPALLIVKWVISALVIGVMLWKVAPIVGAGGYGAIAGIMFTVACGWTLALTWRKSISSIVANPIGALYDGGIQQIEPEAYYSVAEAKRKRGLYTEAVAEIRKQLDRFPTDVRGHFLLAEIQAENLNDLPGAEITLQRFCNQEGHAPRNITFALNLQADFQLKYAQDPEAARQSLEKVITLFPDTDMAESARQRIAHLVTTERMQEMQERKLKIVPQGAKSVGLMASSAHLAPAAPDLDKSAAELVEHLTLHPHDAEAREKLAILYTDHYGRADLAADQLEQLIEVPNQTPRNVARWLNLMADLQVRAGADYDTVRATLERIIERLPEHSSATLARNRIDKLKLELKSKGKNEDVKLGSYDQYMGLKQGRPGAN